MKNHKQPIAIVALTIMLLGINSPLVAIAAGPSAVNLLSANNFTILSKSGITNTGGHTTAITGNIGSSPITGAAMSNVFCSEITGTIYGVDAGYVGSGDSTCFAGNPPAANKTLVDNAVLDMATAYDAAAAMTNPTATELGAGNIGGMTLAPGLYKWSSNVTIPTNITLSGSASDVWVFQIAGNLDIASGGSVSAGTKVILSGGAQAANIFWQVGGVTGATLGTYSTFNGTILSAKQIIMQTGAILNGKALAQTQVTLDANVVSSAAVLIPVETPIVEPVVDTPPAVIPVVTPTPIVEAPVVTPTPIVEEPVVTPVITPVVTETETITPTTTISPKLPSTGSEPTNTNITQILFSLLGLGAFSMTAFYMIKRKILS